VTDSATDTHLAETAEAAAMHFPVTDLVRVTITVTPHTGFGSTTIRSLHKADAEALLATARDQSVM
jgi:L-fucose isomerase-like protein